MALNIADLAEHAIDAVPDRVALISGDETLTYGELEEKANRLAHYLIDQGADPRARDQSGASALEAAQLMRAGETEAVLRAL